MPATRYSELENWDGHLSQPGTRTGTVSSSPVAASTTSTATPLPFPSTLSLSNQNQTFLDDMDAAIIASSSRRSDSKEDTDTEAALVYPSLDIRSIYASEDNISSDDIMYSKVHNSNRENLNTAHTLSPTSPIATSSHPNPIRIAVTSPTPAPSTSPVAMHNNFPNLTPSTTANVNLAPPALPSIYEDGGVEALAERRKEKRPIRGEDVYHKAHTDEDIEHSLIQLSKKSSSRTYQPFSSSSSLPSFSASQASASTSRLHPPQPAVEPPPLATGRTAHSGKVIRSRTDGVDMHIDVTVDAIAVEDEEADEMSVDDLLNEPSSESQHRNTSRKPLSPRPLGETGKGPDVKRAGGEKKDAESDVYDGDDDDVAITGEYIPSQRHGPPRRVPSTPKPPPPPRQSTPKPSSPLFTPSSSSLSPHTPPSTRRQRPQHTTPRTTLAYISMPPLPTGVRKAAYKPLPPSSPVPLQRSIPVADHGRPVVPKKLGQSSGTNAREKGTAHISVGEALKAQLGYKSGDRAKLLSKSPPAPSTSTSTSKVARSGEPNRGNGHEGKGNGSGSKEGQVHVHSSVGDALKAVLAHNASVPDPYASTSGDGEAGKARGVKRKQSISAVAGPSSMGAAVGKSRNKKAREDDEAWMPAGAPKRVKGKTKDHASSEAGASPMRSRSVSVSLRKKAKGEDDARMPAPKRATRGDASLSSGRVLPYSRSVRADDREAWMPPPKRAKLESTIIASSVSERPVSQRPTRPRERENTKERENDEVLIDLEDIYYPHPSDLGLFCSMRHLASHIHSAIDYPHPVVSPGGSSELIDWVHCHALYIPDSTEGKGVGKQEAAEGAERSGGGRISLSPLTSLHDHRASMVSDADADGETDPELMSAKSMDRPFPANEVSGDRRQSQTEEDKPQSRFLSGPDGPSQRKRTLERQQSSVDADAEMERYFNGFGSVAPVPGPPNPPAHPVARAVPVVDEFPVPSMPHDLDPSSEASIPLLDTHPTDFFDPTAAINSMDTDILYDGNVLESWEPEFQRHSSLNTTEDSHKDYIGNGTIDPSLLGGGSASESHPVSPSPPPSPLTQPPHSSERVDDKPPAASSSRLTWKREDSTSLSTSRPVRRKSGRIPVPRSLTSFDPSADPGISYYESDDSVYKSSKSKGSRTLADAAPRRSTGSQKPSVKSMSIEPKPSRRSAKQKQPIAEVDVSFNDSTFCHHCRRTTLHDKMRCTTIDEDGDQCGKRFCVGCITKRYPDIEFDSYPTSFTCPVCTGTCNCSICSRKRGEEYIPERNGGYRKAMGLPLLSEGPDTIAPPSFLREDTKLTLIPGTIDSQVAGVPANYWGTVYSITAAEKVGVVVGGAIDEAKSVSSRPIVRSRRGKPRRRIFVGAVQECWRLAPNTTIGDVADAKDRHVSVKGKGKGRAPDPSVVRTYVGKLSALYEPCSTWSAITSESPPPPLHESLSIPSSPSSTLTMLSAPPDDLDWPQQSGGEYYDATFSNGPDESTWVQAGDTHAVSFTLQGETLRAAIELGLAAVQPT